MDFSFGQGQQQWPNFRFDGGATPSNDPSLQFMAVGSRLNMATYTKKESTNPQVQAAAGLPGSVQKQMRDRKLRQ